jgi:aspartate/methionine/tyrosine aminotransferase
LTFELSTLNLKSMTMQLPLRMQAVQTPVIPVVAELIRSHPGTISLGQGVVGYPPPASAFAEVNSFLRDPQNHKYKPVQGIPPLLELLGTKLQEENGIATGDGSAVIVTAGGNMAFMNAILAITDPNDEVILQTPYYFNHEMAVTMAGCRPVLILTDDQFQLEPDRIAEAITSRTRAISTISPNNPTGAVYSESSLREVNRLCRERGLYHIHDEAYEYFIYGNSRHFSPGSIPESAPYTISLFSLSKAYGFASWRIGYMVAPAALLESIKKIQDTILICAPVISQFAAVGALRAGPEFCREKIAEIASVRELVLNELKAAAEFCAVPAADGAFYFLVRVNTSLSPMGVTERLVSGHRVAVIPGGAFGFESGCFVRLAYGALDRATALEAVGRFVRGIKKICEADPGK